MTIINVLSQRQLLINHTSSDLPEKLCVYVGIDATKDSLHVGTLIVLNMLRIFKKYGHKTIVLLGSATTLIGDPSWKTESRPMLSRDEVQHNLDCLTQQIEKLIQPDEIVYNHEWLGDMNMIDFIRDVGSYFSVNQLIKLETFESRIRENRNLSFLEFTYPLMQGYDFLYLNRKYGCNVQIGGSDQWGNIIQGLHLVHKLDKKEVYGLTNQLLTTSDGTKMGKSVNGAVFLDEKLVSSYDFWQFWRNVDDADVKKFMLQLTDISSEDIDALPFNTVTDITNAKKMLADNITAWVHGDVAAREARSKAEEIFENNNVVDEAALAACSLVMALNHLGLVSSNSEAKRSIAAGSVKINSEKIVDTGYIFMPGEYVLEFAKKKKFKIVIK